MPQPVAPDAPARLSRSWGLVAAALATLALCLLVPVSLADPWIRSDDYPALLGDAGRFYGKTLSEGRWLNWLWHMRPAVFEARPLFLACLLAWGGTAGALAWAVFRADRRPWRMLALALAIAVTPQMGYQFNWPATTVPVAVLTAALAVALAAARGRQALWLIALAVPPMLMMHGSYPMLLLVMAALAPRWEDRPGEALHLSGVFVLAYAAGVLAIFAVNLAVHGHFGVKIAAWRNPMPAEDLESLIRNLQRAIGWAMRDVFLMAAKRAPAALALGLALVAAAVLALRRAPRPAMRLLLALGLAVAMVMAQVTLTGVVPGFRAGPFLFVAILLVFALAARSAKGQGRWLWMLPVLAMMLPGAAHWRAMHGAFVPAQVESRRIAAALLAAGAADASRLVLLGDPRRTPHGAVAQGPETLPYRLGVLTGRPALLCLRFPQEPPCAAARAMTPPAPEDWTPEAAIFPGPEGSLILRLPDPPAEDGPRP